PSRCEEVAVRVAPLEEGLAIGDAGAAEEAGDQPRLPARRAECERGRDRRRQNRYRRYEPLQRALLLPQEPRRAASSIAVDTTSPVRGRAPKFTRWRDLCASEAGADTSFVTSVTPAAYPGGSASADDLRRAPELHP